MTPRACPFCRIYVADASVSHCDTCDVPLIPVAKLGPSPEERMAWEAMAPDERPIPISPFSHGRALLSFAALVGIVAYLMPWLEVRSPDRWILHGTDFGRRLFWPHAALAAWVVALPTAMSRRTFGRLLASRAVLAVFAAVPLVTLVVLYAKPPTHKLLHVESTWLWGAALEGLASILGLFAALRLGRGTRA